MAKVSRTKLAKAFVDLLQQHSLKRAVPVLAAELVRLKMTGQLDLLLRDITAELFARTGNLSVDVTSAHKLTDQIRRQVTELAKELTGAKTVLLQEFQDEGVVGGVLVRTNQLEVNLTIDDKLRRLAA